MLQCRDGAADDPYATFADFETTLIESSAAFGKAVSKEGNTVVGAPITGRRLRSPEVIVFVQISVTEGLEFESWREHRPPIPFFSEGTD